jgi:ferredoxin
MNVSFLEFKNIVKRLKPETLDDVLQRARVVIKNPNVERCEFCKQIPLIPWRAGRKFCTRACKQKAYRQRKVKK